MGATEPVVEEASTLEVSTRLGPDLLSLMPQTSSNATGPPEATSAGGGVPARHVDNVASGAGNVAEPLPPKVAAADVFSAALCAVEVSDSQSPDAAAGALNDAADGNVQPL